LNALATKTPTPPHRIVPALPRRFTGLVMRLLAKDPADRMQTALEVVAAIEALERGETEELELEVLPAEEAAATPSAAVEKRERKRDEPRPKRPRVRSRKPQPKPRKDWSIWVLVAGAVLLVVAALVCLFVLLHHPS